MPSCQAGSLDKKALCCVKLSALRPNCVTGPGGSDERTDEAAAAGPSDIQRLRGIGDVGCPRGRSVVGVALAGAPDRGHVADTHRTIRGRPRAVRLGRRSDTGHAGARSRNEARAPCLDLVPVGG